MTRFINSDAIDDYIDVLANGTHFPGIGQIPAWEGDIRFFYKDHRGLLTIGIGHLVDAQVGMPLTDRRAKARAFADKYRNCFFPSRSVPEIVADWEAARSSPLRRRHPGVVSVTLGLTMSRVISKDDIEIKENALRRIWGHWTDHLDSSIQMALIDHLFNPSGGRIGVRAQFGGKMGQLQDALNKTALTYDPSRAAVIYKEIGNHLSSLPRYQKRVAWRAALIEEGAVRMRTP